MCLPAVLSQWKKEKMYEIRDRIRDCPLLGGGIQDVARMVGKRSETLMDEALLEKDPEDGQNLLTYAAAQGKEDWFLHLLQYIRERVRNCKTSTSILGALNPLPSLLFVL